MYNNFEKIPVIEKVRLIKDHGVHLETFQKNDLFIEIYALDKDFNFQFGEIQLDLNEYAFKNVQIISPESLEQYLSDTQFE